ncbi:hypothetical protein SASPL_127144 [Salvia splendens]|uniref:MHD domain-containing protein n=1 Tax=Salvia splendens TaxID=180675 RepID=A0A8X8ZQN4_SALSN|nr:uncharacterized protein LOC121747644 [Salvia splendens]KAG6414422.1 hypothetical protein SASPL_127144 [Salvia splendens]
MSCLAVSLQPTNGPDVMVLTREWFPPSRALMALSSFRHTRFSADLLGDDPLAASSGQVVVGVESRYRVVYRLVNSIYVLGVTTTDDSNNNVFDTINVVNQAVAVVVTACRGVDVSPEKLGKKYAEIYMALDIILRGTTTIRLSAMLASMHGDSIAKMVHSSTQTEAKIRGANTWPSVEPDAVQHQDSTHTFSRAFFELPLETLHAGDVIASGLSSHQGEEKEKEKVNNIDNESDPFAASDRIHKPDEMLMEGFKKDKEGGVSDMSKALAGLEVTALPPSAATESTHIGVEGFEGDYGGVEFSNEGPTLPEDFEGLNDAWGGGLDASEFVGPKKLTKDHGLGGLELLATRQAPPISADQKAEMQQGPEMCIVEEISAEFRESVVARVGLKGVVFLKTKPPNSSSNSKETEFSFKVEGTQDVKRFVVQSSKISSLGNNLFHVRTALSDEAVPVIKYSLLPHSTPLPIRVRLVKRLVGTLLSLMIQYVPNPDLPAPLKDVTFVMKLPVDPTLLKVSPKAVLNRADRELKWHVDELPAKGSVGRLRARMPVDIGKDDDGSELEIFGRVEFASTGNRSLSGISLRPAGEGSTDFYEVEHRYASGHYFCN